jgi:hypothetical protein
LAPTPKSETTQKSKKSAPREQFDSQEFVASFNTGMHKCLEFGKEAAQRTAKLVKEKVKELRDA